MNRFLSVCALFSMLFGSGLPAQELTRTDSEILFVRRVGPLLREKCLGCHGGTPDEIEGSLDVRTMSGLLAGGDSGEAAVVPGKPEASPIYLSATRQSDDWSEMPPKQAEQLSKVQLEWLRDWIASGAVWPDANRRKEIENEYEKKWASEDGIPVKTSGGLGADWTNRKYDPAGLWAYQPVKKVELKTDGKRNTIDLLIEQAFPESLRAAPRADRRTLIRRASFDLTGLPPTPQEVEAFLQDPAPDHQAFAKIVDRLLRSPHYGERMAQHWLDVTRYADSSGFANDFERGNAWRYRDYVVRAFNNDKPYDQFVREQIAGDEIDPNNPELLIATGFLRMGPWELTGMEVPKVARQRFLDDVTNSIGETFLAHSLQCARCHDHKFDPVPTRDYYSIQAVFATTQLAERKAEFLDCENRSGFDEEAYLRKKQQDYRQILAELDKVQLDKAQKWFEKHPARKKQWDEVIRKLKANGRKEDFFNGARFLMSKAGVPESEYPPNRLGFSPKQFGLERIARKGLQRLKWELDRYQPYALSVYDGLTREVKAVVAPTRIPKDRLKNGELERTAILAGGDPFSPTEPVSPGTLSVIDHLVPASIPKSVDGRRLAFANWVASSRNPLTTRTIVNRLWLWHFGEPIAGNPNNFGSTGKRPTHPKLLDWLAATLLEENWSIKAMHRRIMLSDAYCRSSRHPYPELLRKLDPQRHSYAVFRPRRLSAEELRDTMLAITGELNRTVGGIPCRPEINLEVALQPRQVMGTIASAWTPNPLPEQRNRRSLYVLKLRGLIDPMLNVFNLPSPDFSCERRDTSTVTPQVFTLFNSQNSLTRALTLAQRAVKETSNDREALVRCFQLAYLREPTPRELQESLSHWHELEKLLPEQPPSTAAPPRQIIREAVEENTGEKYTFVEKLYANSDYVPDLQPADVDRHTRALGDFCLILLNSNEFVYLY